MWAEFQVGFSAWVGDGRATEFGGCRGVRKLILTLATAVVTVRAAERV